MDFDSSNLFVFMYRWRRPLIIFPVIAAIAAAIFSSPTFIDPLFQSTVVVFPSTTNSVSKALLPQQSGQSEDILEFGDEQQAEQLLQILNSDEIRNRIVKKYQLMDHYGIDSTSDYPKTALIKAYQNRITFQRTQFQSVEISVLDTDPDTAAMIANDIAKLLDEVKKRIQKERAQVAMKIVQREYERMKGEVEQREQILMELRKKGIQDYETQSAVLSEQLAVAMISGKSDAARKISNQLDTLSKYGGVYLNAKDELSLMKEELMKVRVKLDQARVDLEQDLPATFKVNDAFPAERKTYPVRSLIVLIAFFGTFIFTLVMILILTTIRQANGEKEG
ncbi:MAG: hypothetical protein LPK80_09755 [Bacteroidota bacterium]|nr:hypothetical protein [Bacteroidota bacterium]MDX5446803.1 hypothetical protein [Bacteroidota bacterium]